MSDSTTVDSWDAFVHSPAFDKECREQSKRLSPTSNPNSSAYSSERGKLREGDDPSEAHLYYFGLRGPRHLGPKMVHRTSEDVFTPPSGPAQDAREMQLLPVYYHEQLGKNKLWRKLLPEFVEALDRRGIQFNSIDFVRFRWEEPRAGGGSEMFTTRPTIWIGALPDTLTRDVASESSKDILKILESHGISDVETAHRESVTMLLNGPAPFAPVSDLHSLKDVIDPVTTALGMPIAGLKTPHLEGTLGFYFRTHEGLFGVTARHVMFPEAEGNEPYLYHPSAPKKVVVLMGTKASDDLLASTQAQIGTLNSTIIVLDKRIATLTKKVEQGGPDAEQAATDLATTEADKRKKLTTIEDLRNFYARLKRDWSELPNRVIGYVVWAPPISAWNEPHGYTKDVCVIKLDDKKFGENFKGNVIDLGTEREPGEFISLMCPRDEVSREFDYPEDRLFKLDGILSADEIYQPNNGDAMRLVLKRGLATRTTIGHLIGFESYQRRYSALGNLDSIEAAILPYNNKSGPFSRGGDSGSLIADGCAKFGALLTGGTGQTDSSDITYGTPIHWLWNDVILPQFPGASLYFDLPEN